MKQKRDFSCIEELTLLASSSGKTPFEIAREEGPPLSELSDGYFLVTLDGKFHFFDGGGNHSEPPKSGFVLTRDSIPNKEKLTSIEIPYGVTYIWYGAFSGCTGLTSVTIPDSVTSIGEGAFSDCISLTSVTIPDSVTSIGKWMFGRCKGLASVTIPKRFEKRIDDIFWKDAEKTVKFEFT